MIYIVILFSISLIFLFFYFGNKPKKFICNVNENYLKYFEVLLYRGYQNGCLFLTIKKDKKPKRIIQFSKYIDSRKCAGIQLDYPMANWSMSYYEKLKDLLNKNNIKYEIEKTGQTGVPEFLTIDLIKDIEKAYHVSKIIFKELYCLGNEEKIELYFKNISPKEERIGI